MDRTSRSLAAGVVALCLAGTACVSASPTNAAQARADSDTIARPIATTSSVAPEPSVPVSVAPAPPQPDTGVATVPPGGAPLSASPGELPYVTAHEGLLFAVSRIEGDWMEVLTGCDTHAWVPKDAVEFERTSNVAETGPGFDLTTAVAVIDPGHGGPNIGATGPTGLIENEANLAIARRVRTLLLSSHDVDWESGLITPGDDIPALGQVLLTRTEGPAGADFEAGLLFRATLATAAGADVVVSIHNNAAPEGPLTGPGSEVFYSVASEESRRLAGILYEEFLISFSRFDIDWVGNSDRGARYRLSRDGFIDYYGILRRAGAPTALAEGLFISNPAEEALLRSRSGQQAYAEAVYRAVVRFLTTDDTGSGWSDPIPVTAPVAGSGDAREDCLVPPQPGTELRSPE